MKNSVLCRLWEKGENIITRAQIFSFVLASDSARRVEVFPPLWTKVKKEQSIFEFVFTPRNILYSNTSEHFGYLVRTPFRKFLPTNILCLSPIYIFPVKGRKYVDLIEYSILGNIVKLLRPELRVVRFSSQVKYTH